MEGLALALRTARVWALAVPFAAVVLGAAGCGGSSGKISITTTTATTRSGAATATSNASSQKLYTALLTTAYPDSQLPSGFLSATVGSSSPSDRAKALHVIGEIQVSIDGPDPDDGILYAIFPDVADAKADLAQARPTGDIHLVPGGVPGSSLPGRMWAGSITGKNALGQTVTNGATVLEIQKGTVLVAVITDSADNTSSGNVPGALALLRSGLHHLRVVEKKIAGQS